jgi:hypothetical protein
MPKYRLEFVFSTQTYYLEDLKNALLEFGEHLEIFPLPESYGKGKDFKIRILAQDPTLIFDACSPFGKLKSVKIKET